MLLLLSCVSATRAAPPARALATAPPPATLTGDAAPIAPCAAGMASIPAGTFLMGSLDDVGEYDERPQVHVQMHAFCMDITEVTVGAYAACQGAGACSARASSMLCNADTADRQDHPANCVSWSAADAFCRWRAARLPTEAEWEYAARGSDGRSYPWGDAAPATQLCWRRYIEGTCAVGSFPVGASPFGLLDMAGNVWEWTADWYASYYSSSTRVSPTGPATGTARIIRGGGYLEYQTFEERSADRANSLPDAARPHLGFRCADAVR